MVLSRFLVLSAALAVGVNSMHADPSDKGYLNSPHGYYDIQGLGVAADYCRYVGDSSNGGIWPSCALAGSNNEYTPKGVIKIELVNNGLSPVIPKPTSPVALPSDKGYPGIEPQGYYDIFGIGQAVDYCRMVGDYPGYPSCALAGTNQSYTTQGKIQVNFALAKAVPVDWGYSDRLHGYYDIQGLGVAADYCRYVGDYPNIWASCKLAGTNKEYTPVGVVEEKQNTFVLKKADPSDKGYLLSPHGYYDIQGLGVAADYCRYVGDSGKNGIWPSCALAGSNNQYTAKGVIKVKLVNNGLPPVTPKPTSPVALPSDKGYTGIEPQGYYDIFGIGQAVDYCRMVGDYPGFPSCALAGTNVEATPLGAIKAVFVGANANANATANFGISRLRVAINRQIQNNHL